MGSLFFRERRCESFFVAVLLLFSSICEARPAVQPPAKSARNLPGADIFDATDVIRIQITIPRSGLNLLRGSGWGGGDQSRPTARALVSDGKNSYTNVAVHLKGAAGSFRPIDDNPALTLNFEKFAPGQTFHGLHKISLNNSIQDATFITEKLCREMYAAAGVPAPRADYAVVTLNGRNLGLRVLVEGYNKQFLHRYFKNVDGNLYDGGFCKEITQHLTANSGEKMEDQSDLRRLASAAASARQNNRLADLSHVLDLNRFISMIALEVIQCHWDGYALNRNNYRVYHDLDTDRMVFMPHGLDQMFGTGERASSQMRIIPPMNGLVASAVIGTTEGRERYLQRLRELKTNVFKVEAITNRVRQLEARLRPVLAEVEPRHLARHEYAVNYLCQNIVERGVSLEQQLDAPTHAAAFGTSGVIKVEGWKPRNSAGSAILDLATTAEGRKLLHIPADQNNGAASWRVKMLLKKGRYRFEGLGLTRGTGRDGENGAGLRISGAAPKQRLQGDTGWTQMANVFEVREPVSEVELICELKGTRGEAWFDPASLTLKRLEEP